MIYINFLLLLIEDINLLKLPKFDTILIVNIKKN